MIVAQFAVPGRQTAQYLLWRRVAADGERPVPITFSTTYDSLAGSKVGQSIMLRTAGAWSHGRDTWITPL
jgi:hypothetical protein